MPNYCTFEGIIKSPNKEDILDFIDVITANYNYHLTKDAQDMLKTFIDIPFYDNLFLRLDMLDVDEPTRNKIKSIIDDPKNYTHIPEKGHFYRVFETYGAEPENITFEDSYYTLVFSGYCAWSLGACFSRDGYYENDDNPCSTGTCIELWGEKHHDVQLCIISTEPGCMFSEQMTLIDGNVSTDVGDYGESYAESYEEFQEIVNNMSDPSIQKIYIQFNENNYPEYLHYPIPEWFTLSDDAELIADFPI